MKTCVVGILAALAVAAPAAAQHDPSAHSKDHSAYASQESSGIAALSRQERDELMAGAGMGMARPAELNHYPGPMHVLELAEELDLTGQQAAEVEAIRQVMLERAKALGAEIVERERHLNMRFANDHIDATALQAATAEIAELYGALRFTHLRAHLETRALLGRDQIELYDRLRGY